MLLIEPGEVAIRERLDVIADFARIGFLMGERCLEKQSLDAYNLFGYLQTIDKKKSSVDDKVSNTIQTFEYLSVHKYIYLHGSL